MSGVNAPPQRAASHMIDCARVRSSPVNQLPNAFVRLGKAPASPTPNRKRMAISDQNPVASPVAIVKPDHQTTIRVSTARGPMRSPSQPPGTSKIAYARLNIIMTIDPYIRDALDLIEFANGPVTSPWGAKRAALGHPAPFNLRLLGVGNEQWGPQYIERFALFEKVLGQQHPEITLIASADPNFRSDNFPRQWDRLRELKADFVDEHFYQPPDWFLENVGRYDSYPRTGPKVFVGEYAAHVPSTGPQNMRPSTLEAALAEAVFMTGFERNADVVQMSAYAPLLAHVDGWQWTPNLIWFDNLRSFGTQLLRAADVRCQPRGPRAPDYAERQRGERNQRRVLERCAERRGSRGHRQAGQPRRGCTGGRDLVRRAHDRWGSDIDDPRWRRGW